MGESFCKTSLQVRMDLRKVQKQDRDERMQEEYPTLERWQKERQDGYLIMVVFAAEVHSQQIYHKHRKMLKAGDTGSSCY